MTTLAHTASATSTNNVKRTIGSVIKVSTVFAVIGIAAAFLPVQSTEGRLPPAPKEFTQESALLSAAGDHQGAVEASRRAVKMYRHLLRVSPTFYQPRLRTALAARLHELSVRLTEVGDAEGARIAEHEATTIRTRVGTEAPKQAASL